MSKNSNLTSAERVLAHKRKKLDRASAYKKRKITIDSLLPKVNYNADYITANFPTIRTAVLNNDIDSLKALVKDKIDLNIECNYAIKTASEKGYKDIVEYLIVNGADVTAGGN